MRFSIDLAISIEHGSLPIQCGLARFLEPTVGGFACFLLLELPVGCRSRDYVRQKLEVIYSSDSVGFPRSQQVVISEG